MNVKNINKILVTDADTSDIINVVMMAYKYENDPQIRELAESLRGATEYDSCKNIWQYLLDNVQYRADSSTGRNTEEVRTPARLIHDRVGDCKSYSLFTATILRYLNIPCVFRFASYTSRKEATHVYVVAFISDGKEVIIDAVAASQLGYPFNTEHKYSFKCDMKDTGTKIAYLAGLPKRSTRKAVNSSTKIGAVDDDRYSVWTGDETENNITPGKHFLYCRFDYLLELLNITPDSTLKCRYYDQLDIVTALIYGYNNVDGDTIDFERFALNVCGLIVDGGFTSSLLDDNARANNLDVILAKLQSDYDNHKTYSSYDVETWTMLSEEVFPCNEIITIATTAVGAFWPWDKATDRWKAGAYYYMYTYIPDSEINGYSITVKNKRALQLKTLSWCKKVDIWHSNKAIDSLIRGGIIARTGKTPEQFIKDEKAGRVVYIGDGGLTIAILSAVTALIQLLIKVFNKRSEPTEGEVKSSIPEVETELFTAKKKTNSSGSNVTQASSSILPIGLGFGLLLSFIKRN